MADSVIDELLLVEALEDDECFDLDDDFMSDIESDDEENSVLKSVFISAVELSSFDDITNTFNVLCRDQQGHSARESSFVNTVKQSSDDEFSRNFRMTRNTFQNLLWTLEAAATPAKTYKKIPLETKLFVTLWLLATPDSFRSVGNRFNMSKGTTHGIFVEIINSIASLSSDFVKWPMKEQRSRIAQTMHRKCSIPGIVGIIGCCRIYIKAPKENSEDSFNSRYFHSIILQAVCDDNSVFQDLFIGGTGRVHCAEIFKMSPLYGQICDNSELLEPGEHLVGDSDYPLLSNLLVPFRDNEDLTSEKLQFNSHIGLACSVAKRAFSLLKGKWQRLKFLDMGLKNFIPKVIAACCCLHNFIIRNETVGEIDADDTDIDNLNPLPSPYLDFTEFPSSSSGEQKKSRYCFYFVFSVH